MMTMTRTIAFLHYSAPPEIGGVESVMLAHIRLLVEAGYSTSVIAGRGGRTTLPLETDFIRIPELDSTHPRIMEMNQKLEQGDVPPGFDHMVTYLEKALAPILNSVDLLIVHNVFTKHFNLPLTVALFRLLDQGRISRCLAWCHDITWASPTSRSKVFPAYPWDFLRTYRPDITYVTVSRERQRELSDVFGYPSAKIHVIYNGVDPVELLALSTQGQRLIDRLGMWESDLNLIMPVRVTKAKNIELGLAVTAGLRQKGILPKLIVTGPPDPHDPSGMEHFESLLTLRTKLDVVDEARFVYESGPVATEPLLVDMSTVSELLRVSDALFMPSHREGFGMPVLEAGLLGMPVFCSATVPAALEIGRQNVIRFAPEADADQIADLVFRYTEENPVLRLHRHVRQDFTWRSIFQQQIVPLIVESTG